MKNEQNKYYNEGKAARLASPTYTSPPYEGVDETANKEWLEGWRAMNAYISVNLRVLAID